MADHSNHKKKHMMSRVLEVRYTDLEEERRLCTELMVWATKENDTFAKAFANTYMGDYYVAACDEKNAGKYLLNVEELLPVKEGWDNIRLRLYNLLGMYYDMQADEQSTIEYYLKAMAVAERINDLETKCVVLINLAFVFQRHRCYDEALNYYLKAYEIQNSLETCHFRPSLLSDLAEVYLRLGQPEEAKKYIEACERVEEEPRRKEVLYYRNWCNYYAAIGDKEKASEYAELVLANQDVIEEDHLTAFENYYALCDKLLSIGEGKQVQRFLEGMERMSFSGGLDRMKMLEEVRIRYSINFEPKKEHPLAYKRFYQKYQEARVKVNATIVDAMKAAIYLRQLSNQKALMRSEQETLSVEVNHDELTGLYNRKFLEEIMQDSAKGERGRLGLIIFDIDYFKEYNDFYGHMQGDAALQKIAKCIMESANDNIFPCRYGGDEFVSVSHGLSDNEIEQYIGRVRERLHNQHIPHEKSYCGREVTLSIGYALIEDGVHTEVHLLFQLADQALYQSKRSGRNTYTRNRVNVL